MAMKIEFGASVVRDIVWRNVHPEPNTGCWLWSGEHMRRGYGRAKKHSKAKRQMAHTVLWEGFFGPIPDGLEMDHLCCVPSCVNPEHLEPVTPAENMRRRRRPHCKYGHLKDPSFLHDCRECARQRAARQRERQVAPRKLQVVSK